MPVTNRPTVDKIEDIMEQPIKVLDHGFIRLVDYMGDDSAIVQAARVSYGKGTKTVNEDKGLINYLMRHWHSTPFEMCEIKLHVKLPIFVARQWIRHRTANVNEYSARYSVLDREFYIPQREQLAPQSKKNHQGRDSDMLDDNEARYVLELLRQDANNAYDGYTYLINEEGSDNSHDDHRGIARELARMNLTLNYYTQWYWKIDLHNLFHFLMLRCDPHAQYEIRVYADEILKIVEQWVPFAYAAFVEHRLGGMRLSASAKKIIGMMMTGQEITQENSGISKREWDETIIPLLEAANN